MPFGRQVQDRVRRRWSIRSATREARDATIGTSVEIDGLARLRHRYGGHITIGSASQVHAGAVLATHGGDITLGERVWIGPHVVIYGQGGVTIGDFTQIAAQTVITAASHRFSDPDRPFIEQGSTHLGVTIGRDVWVSAGVTILDGITIGDGAVIGAGAVVRQDVAPLAIVAGVPARVIGQRGERHEALTG